MAKTFHDSETPAQGQQVITACAFIHKSFEGTEKVFLPKRAATEKFLPGVYDILPALKGGVSLLKENDISEFNSSEG